MKLNIKDVRILWPFIFTKDKPKKAGQEPGYRATFTLDEDHPAVEEIRDTALAALAEKIGDDKAERWIENNFGIDKKTGVLHWGNKRDESSPDFDGKRFFNAKNDTQPNIQTKLGFRQYKDGTIRDEEGDDVEQDNSEHGKQIYGGCYVNLSVNIVGYKNDNGIGVSIYLLGLRFRRDGDEQVLGATATDDDLSDDDDDVQPVKSKKVAPPAKKKMA